MEKQMLNDIKEMLQSFIAPRLEGIRGDIRSLDAKIDAIDAKSEARFIAVLAKIDAIDTKVESFRRELLSEIHRVEATIRN
jgi:hypothetical protein